MIDTPEKAAYASKIGQRIGAAYGIKELEARVAALLAGQGSIEEQYRQAEAAHEAAIERRKEIAQAVRDREDEILAEVTSEVIDSYNLRFTTAAARKAELAVRLAEDEELAKLKAEVPDQTGAIKARENWLEKQVAEERISDSKPKFTNDAGRKAAATMRRKSDPSYQAMTGELAKADAAVAESRAAADRSKAVYNGMVREYHLLDGQQRLTTARIASLGGFDSAPTLA